MRQSLFAIFVSLLAATPAGAVDFFKCHNSSNFHQVVRACSRILTTVGIRPHVRAGLYAARARGYLGIARANDALADTDRALRLHRNEWFAWFQRGNAYIFLRRRADAEQAFSQVIAIKPRYTLAYTMRGQCRSELGRYEGAHADFARALRLSPRNVPAHFERGRTYLRQGLYRPAIRDFDWILTIEPNHKIAIRLRRAAYRRLQGRARLPRHVPGRGPSSAPDKTPGALPPAPKRKPATDPQGRQPGGPIQIR